MLPKGVAIQAIKAFSILPTTKEGNMKKLLVQLFVIGSVIATYVLPVLADGGGGS